MTEETSILFNRAYTVVFCFKNIKILLKIGNGVDKLTKKCNIIGYGSDKDTISELWSPDGSQQSSGSNTDATISHRSEEQPTSATLTFEDNQSANGMAKNLQFHGQAKHIDVKRHFVPEQVNNGSNELLQDR